MIIHAIPSSINSREYGAGNWKAVEANRLALEWAGLNVKAIGYELSKPETIRPHINGETRHILIEYSLWPDFLKMFRVQYPLLKVYIRTHNAEAYQHLHRAADDFRDYCNLGIWRRCMELLWRDVRCRQRADMLLGISEWDNANYWKWLPGGSPIRYLPYFSPWPYLRSQVKAEPWDLRKRAILSMGGNFDPSGNANVANFDMLAMKLSSILQNEWSFVLTWWSQWHQRVPDVSNKVDVLRECAEPWDLLCQVRALAVLTPLGFGFKTTIMDGLAAGCHVIVHPRLARRLPHQVRELCLVCDPSCDDDVARLENSLSSEPERNNINQQSQEMAVDVFRSTFESAANEPKGR
jgi:hypothetical protein